MNGFEVFLLLALSIRAVAVPTYDHADYYYDEEQRYNGRFNDSYSTAYSHIGSPSMADYSDDDPYMSAHGSRGLSDEGLTYSESYGSRAGSHAHQNGRMPSRGMYDDPADQAEYDLQNARKDVHPLYQWDDCQSINDQRYVINGTSACPVDIAGVDLHADLLEGGLDGTYKITGCFDGKPLYERAGGPDGEERCLYYNAYYGEWQFSIGPEPNEDQLVMYADFGYLSPMDVARWHLAVAFSGIELQLLKDKDEDVYFVASGVAVRCNTSNAARDIHHGFIHEGTRQAVVHDEI